MPAAYAKLLVISNNKETLSALGDLLAALPRYSVTLTNSLDQGERLTRTHAFDTVLMDICLKDQAMARFLDQSGAPIPPPIIVMGGLDDMAQLASCIQAGAADYLLLPTNGTLLDARLRANLQKKRLQEQALVSLRAFNEAEKLADDLRLVILPLAIALSAEKDWRRLLERFMDTAMNLCSADAGALFMRTEDDTLRYEIVRVNSLGLSYDRQGDEEMPYADLPLYRADGQPDLSNVATFAAHEAMSINIADIYDKSAFDFSGTYNFDKQNGYHSISCLTVPLQNQNVIGVLQMRNAIDPETKQIIPFGAYQQLVAESVASQAAVAVHNRRLRQREASLLRYKRELDIGRGIQANFFPAALPQPSGWEISARFHAAREVAGDFYDVFALPHGKIALVIADVCDKGVVAALFMALLRTLLRSTIQQHYLLTAEYSQLATSGKSGAQLPEPADGAALLDTLRHINSYIGAHHADTHIFATLFFGILDPESGRVIYINAGHIPPLLRAPDGDETYLMPSGPALGLLPEAQYSVQEVHIPPGDTLLAITDGVTDARNPAGNLFGVKRLMAIVNGRAYHSAGALLEAIDTAVREHSAGADPTDDITLLAVRRERAS